MSNFSGIFDDVRLIELVENHEIIYNKHGAVFQGTENKRDSWIKIAEDMGMTAEECIKRWTCLRERYTRELKQVETNPNFVVGWPLFGPLSFLRKFIKQRPARTVIEEVDEELLIKLVRNHDVLYSNKGFKCSNLKAKSWLEISEQMGVSVEACYNRWKSLRERYTREIKRDASLSVQWPLFNSLSFLRDSIKLRPYRCTKNSLKDSNMVAIKSKRLKHDCAEANESLGTCYSPPLVCKKEFLIDPLTLPADNALFGQTIEDSREKTVVSNGNEEKFFSSTQDCSENMTNDSINLFGKTVAAIISEMSEAKQAKAMRVLFNALITIKTEPEES
uniref:Transcription factor Adf-1 n=1 Tax=Zeugodacus cucurbitae TaxID=28588 RepID=A0A0A1WTN1_ZEUCU